MRILDRVGENMNQIDAARRKVVIAGASGFVGKALIDSLSNEHDVIGLSRNPMASRPGFEWRPCNLYSLLQAEEGVEGADIAIYLVHSMMPARLTQASFRDIDLILADNFARAAKRAGIRQIIYVGGLLPESTDLSEHLASRFEVATVLGSTGIPVTCIQAGLIVGAGGSSFRILTRLVHRLPIMVCPSWTGSMTQPVSIRDVVDFIGAAVDNPETHGQWFDIGGPEQMTYQAMIEETGRIMGKARYTVRVPVFSAKLSSLWVQLVTKTPRALVAPLIESLRHDMVVKDESFRKLLKREPLSFVESMEVALKGEAELESKEHLPTKRATRYRAARRDTVVYSIQRLAKPAGTDAVWVANEYARWLPSFMNPLIRVEVNEKQDMRFFGIGLPTPLLELSYSQERSTPDRALFYITGGLLADPTPVGREAMRGRLEFRETPDGRSVMAAIYDFKPKLPWAIYRLSQAPVHLWVMTAFGRHLARVDAEDRTTLTQAVSSS